MFKLLPLGEFVVVEPIRTSNSVTKSGLYIPDTSSGEKLQLAKVLAVGEGTKDQPPKIEGGDVVLYPKIVAFEMDRDGQRVHILKQSDVLCKVQEHA